MNKTNAGWIISCFILLVALIISQFAFQSAKSNFYDVAEMLDTCNQRVDTYHANLEDALDKWEYYMNLYFAEFGIALDD